MTGAGTDYGTGFLGIALAVYGLSGLFVPHFIVPKSYEPVLGPMCGAVTGAISAATGVFVIPAAPYLQALGFGKEEFVQALGLSFTVSTIALAVNVSAEGAFGSRHALVSLIALALACLGMWTGQALRKRLSPAAFRRGFFAGLFLLGLYLAARSWM